MSIIERAIDKLGGVEEAVVVDSDKPNAEVTSGHAQQRQEKPQIASERQSLSKNATDAGIGGGIAPTTVTPIEVDKGINEKQEPQKPSLGGQVREEVTLDFERMKAAGFLVPEGGITGQSEEYQSTKRRILGNTVAGMSPSGRPANLILVTSSVPSEGKTFSSTNLAMSIAAEIDRSVLLIDADIAKRDLTRVFGGLGKPGLFDYLSDVSLDLADVIVKTNLPNFSFIPAGLRADYSTEMLASERMVATLTEVSNRYPDRLVIIDSPPVLVSSAAMALAPMVGQIILVVESGKTKQETLGEALRMLEGVQITGILLNKSKQIKRGAYDYYGYYYGANT